MTTYFLKRILFFIPTLFIISLVAFAINVNSPFDPVDNFVGKSEEIGAGLTNIQNTDEIGSARQRMRKKFNLDLPSFYFRMASLAEPDTFYKIYDRSKRHSMGQLLDICGNWESVQAYSIALKNLYHAHGAAYEQISSRRRNKDQNLKDLGTSFSLTKALMSYAKPEGITHRFFQLDTLYASKRYFQPLKDSLIQVRFKYEQLYTRTTQWKKYVPRIVFHGTENQYHKWISCIITQLDFGRSYQNAQPISQRMGSLFFWSFMFTLISIIIAYLISLPLGIIAATFHGTRFDKVSSVAVFGLDSLPNFWVATLLLFAFANPDALDWFPSSFNVIAPSGESLFETMFRNSGRMILPLIAYTYGNIAFASRMMRSSMLEVMQEDYIRTARAKGLRERWVILRHGFRNATLPIITGFASIFPALMGGNIILETIFAIPGMGREAYESLFSQDIPMIMAVVVITGFLTILGYLVSDVLYSLADPRIKYDEK